MGWLRDDIWLAINYSGDPDANINFLFAQHNEPDFVVIREILWNTKNRSPIA